MLDSQKSVKVVSEELYQPLTKEAAMQYVLLLAVFLAGGAINTENVKKTDPTYSVESFQDVKEAVKESVEQRQADYTNLND